MGFNASSVEISNPTASPNVDLSSNNLTIVSCASNPLFTAKWWIIMNIKINEL